MAVIATVFGGEGGEEGGTVDGTEIVGPDRCGKDSQLTEEVGTEHERGSKATFEGPEIAPLLPAGKPQCFCRQTIKHFAVGIPPQSQAQSSIVDSHHVPIAGIDLATTMLEEDVDGDIEGQPRLRGIEGDTL